MDDTHATTLNENLSLPTRFGGLAIHIFYEQAEVEYRNLGNLTAQLTPLIKNQNKQYTVDKTLIKIAKQVVKKEKQDRRHTSQDQLKNNLSALPISDIFWSYQSNILGVQFPYGMNGALQIY